MRALHRQAARTILNWYALHARSFPWRVPPGARRRGHMPDPYRVWISEIMLQQTTTKVAAPYFERFVARWPTIGALAAAPPDEILALWSGLGYYARARNAARCAQQVVDRHGGTFPRDIKTLRALPGIGPYIAGALVTIAWNAPAPVVDGNIARIITRLYGIETPLPHAMSEAGAIVEHMMRGGDCGDLAEGLMDLGAMICRPRQPLCKKCVLRPLCRAYAGGAPEVLPLRSQRRAKAHRHGTMHIVLRGRTRRAVLLCKRGAKGVLAGMASPPASPFICVRQGERRGRGHQTGPMEAALPGAPGRISQWRRAGAPLRHTFTHFHLTLDVWRADVAAGFAAPQGCWWAPIERLEEEALPSLMRKAIAQALALD